MISTPARRFLTLAAVAALMAPVASAQSPLPSPEALLGYPLGAHFTDYAGVQRYALALAEASPLVEYRPYGVTPERRELFQLLIAKPEFQLRLGEILAANAELARPETSAARAQQIAATNPAVVYLGYGIHGNESSSSEAALWTAWDLARGAETVAGVLDSVIVVMDPVSNPDGRDRYVQWFRTAVGATPNPDPQAREHREPWPGGRYNHYLFDLNRDWAWMTQPETRARLATWSQWNPVVHVDFHEMGYNSSYFFFPAAAPINPIYPDYVLEWGQRFGQANARAFDARGWAYFTGDNYDLFYPGYGDSWPSLLGAIGMTYEQAGSGAGGLAVEQLSGDTLTLRDRALHHWTSGAATLRTIAAGKSRLLDDYAAAQRSVGVDEPDYLLVPGADTTRILALVTHLRRQGIEVERAGSAFRNRAEAFPEMTDRSEFPAGSYRVRARQARGRLVTTLLQPRTHLDAEFSYDISAWSLPYAYGVEAHLLRDAADADWSAVGIPSEAAPVAAPTAEYGYLILPGESAAAGLVAFLRDGGRARVLAREGTYGGQAWPAGTWFLPMGGNDSLQARATAAGLGGMVVPVATGMATSGIDLGSAFVRPVRLPNVAVLAGEGITPTSYGAHWSFLEQQLGLHFDALLASEIERLALARYDVIVVPDANERVFDAGAREILEAWVRAGGRLVGVAGGAVAIAPIADVKVREDAPADSAAREALLAGRLERERQEWLAEVPGAILRTVLDPAHPLAWGAGMGAGADRLFVLHEGTRAFEPAEGVEAVAYFPLELDATSGVISDENLERLQEGAWLVTRELGRGSVVLFADDPLFRRFWKATQPLYLNALLIGPGS